MDIETSDETELDLGGAGANTLIEYRYVDASNNKVSGRAVLEGRIPETEVARMVASLDEDMYFIPGQVGLPDLQGEFTDGPAWNGEVDHVWHVLAGLSYTDEAPTPGLDSGHVETLTSEWPDKDGWDEEGHAALLADAAEAAPGF